MKAHLRRRDMTNSLEEGQVDKDTSKKSVSTIIPALADSPLHSIQDSNSDEVAWDRFQHRYTGRIIVNMFGALKKLFNTKFKNDTYVRDRVAHLESQFSP